MGKWSKKFGERLTQLLEETKMPAAELASKVGIPRQSIYHYKGGGTPELDTAVGIAQAFEMSLSEFLGEVSGHDASECARRVAAAVEQAKQDAHLLQELQKIVEARELEASTTASRPTKKS